MDKDILKISKFRVKILRTFLEIRISSRRTPRPRLRPCTIILVCVSYRSLVKKS